MRTRIAILVASVLATCALTASAQKVKDCAPAADISPANRTVAENERVTLNGRSSKDATTYVWEQTSGPSVTLQDANTDKPEFVAPEVGSGGAVLTFRLTVTGCVPTQSSSLDTTVTVTDLSPEPPPNQRPTAAAQAPATVIEGTPVTLDGSASSDPDGDTLSFEWTQLDGPTVLVVGSSSALATFTAPNEVPYAGATLSFRLRVTDSKGLYHDAVVSVGVTHVNRPPVIDLFSCPVSVDERADVLLAATASDDGGAEGLSYLWRHLEGPSIDTTLDMTASSLAFHAPSLGREPASLVFKLVVSDGSLQADTSCTVEIKDITPPNLHLPGDMTQEATSSAGAMVTFEATAEDAHDPSVDVTCAPTSGSTFALGETTVACSAKDAAGNEADGSFKVTVRDTTPPEITVPADMTVEATSAAGAAATFSASATDLVDVTVAVTCGPVSGSTFALGQTTVACSATDAAGNEAIASFKVDVTDTTPPAIAPHDDVIVVLGSATSYTVPVATDLVDGAVAVTCIPVAGFTFSLGATPVSCSASDTRGNVARSTFKVTVQFAPVGLCLDGPGHQVLQPIDLTGRSVFQRKSGSTIPVKFRVCDAQGNSIASPNPAVSFQLVAAFNGTTQETPNEESVSTLGDVAFRWSPADRFWIYNLSTRPYVAGATYRFRIGLIDGTAIEFQVGLK